MRKKRREESAKAAAKRRFKDTSRNFAVLALLVRAYRILIGSTAVLLCLLAYVVIQLFNDRSEDGLGVFGVAVALLSAAGWKTARQAEEIFNKSGADHRLMKLARRLFLICSLSLGGGVAFALSLTPALRPFADAIVEHLPQLRTLSVTIIKKVSDYIIGGVVFELARSSFNRQIKKILLRG
ncbi:MAG TPA: hypothetical protein VNA69_16165 [Thermoanaerobaculia bacterium]|nr:hypothetical protein [Thermoanaerobaculia bacterium]